MKAVILSKTGSLDNLKYTDYEKASAKKDELLIKVDYCGVNHLDLLIVKGKRTTSRKFPLILGSEIAGKILETNEKVVIYPWTFCGKCKQCKQGNENICDEGGTFGRTRNGGYAEYIAVPRQNIIKIPDNVDHRHICASTLSAATALHMFKRSGLLKNSLVLVNGASGGVGTALIQILKKNNCRIIVTTSHIEKAESLKKTGAEIVIESKNLENTIKEYFPDGIPYIFDIMGGEIWSRSLEILAKNGTIVFCATTLDEPGRVNMAKAFSRQMNILGSYGGTIGDLKEVITLVKNGILKPVIDSVYPLKEVYKALQKLKEQKAFGKILIKVR